jgi:hypothetical protein
VPKVLRVRVGRTAERLFSLEPLYCAVMFIGEAKTCQAALEVLIAGVLLCYDVSVQPHAYS